MSLRYRKIWCFVILFFAGAVTTGYDFDANDFATEVIDYVEGVGVIEDVFSSGNWYNNPDSAIGRPTIDTTGDFTAAAPWEAVTVVPVYGALRYYELVSVGLGGRLILKFNHRVQANKANPYGLDFIVFGNAFPIIGGSTNWYQTSNPSTFYINSGSGNNEPGLVSVSQDGIVWYAFTNDTAYSGDPNYLINSNAEDGPFADDFAPTLGRVYDLNNPDVNAFAGNLYWGRATNPTLPMDPNLYYDDYHNKTMAQICTFYYGESAGGRGFDIDKLDLPADPNTGLKWIRYVRIDNPADSGHTPEIDAVADVSGCGDWKHPFPDGDISENCTVGYEDIEMLSQYWLCETSGLGNAAKSADIFEDEDNTVNLADWAILTKNFFKCSCDCE